MSGRKRNYWNGVDGSKVYWTWLVNQERNPTFEQAAENLESPEPPVELWRVLALLTDKQRFVIGLRYGTSGHGFHTLDHVADLMGISHQAVDQIERRALSALAKGLKNEG
jgi:DNA-directed RNA polymerase sigma subunit (sigma70/sigma32)